MPILNPIALIGWIAVVIALFNTHTPRKATIIAVMGAFLFLPMSLIDLPLLPSLNKTTSISFGIVLGELLSGSRQKNPFKLSGFDVPMVLWCFLSPLLTSLSNGLGLYDGFSNILANFFSWGVIFWAGRRYFGSPESIRDLTNAILIGGLLYVPVVLFEVRMSPKLHLSIYGFFQHSFDQHFRYGGYRPIGFMQHGLMVALWMAEATTTAFWLWRSRCVEKAWKVPIALAFLAFAGSVVLCKSGNGAVFTLLGILTYFVYSSKRSSKLLKWFILFIPCYFFFRLSNIVTIPQIEAQIARFFDPERVASLVIRLRQENLFGDRALLRPFLGWGGYGRGWPVDPETGAQLIQMVDSFWIIVFSTSGIFGLFSIYASLGLGPLSVLAKSGVPKGVDGESPNPFKADAVVLSLVVTFFLLDSLINSMVSPVYILCAGALASYYERGSEHDGIAPLEAN